MAVVNADTKAVWLALISPNKWWKKEHTWSGDAANMMLRPQAGGCFCERIPEDPNSDEVTLEGSVEHMRVIQSFPEKVLRMRGGLGPLQSEAATGVLTIAIGKSETDGEETTTIVWEYVVGGYMRYETPKIAKAVDGVMALQLGSLAEMLGATNMPEAPAEEEPADPAPETSEEDESGESDDRMAALEEAVEALSDE
ncbi:MAG: SRPBCC family protein, partial [Erythrobacter sp.]